MVEYNEVVKEVPVVEYNDSEVVKEVHVVEYRDSEVVKEVDKVEYREAWVFAHNRRGGTQGTATPEGVRNGGFLP